MDITDETSESAIIRSLHLGAAGANHEPACEELLALRARGWDIEIRGHQRAGEITIKLTRPR